MSLAIAVYDRERDNVLVACDSYCYTNGVTYRVAGKIIESADGWLYAACGSWRIMNLLSVFIAPPLLEHADPDKYMIEYWIEAWYQHMQQNHCDDVEYGILVARRSYFWSVSGGLSVIRPLEGYAAIGAAHQIALGALHATPELPAVDRVKRALDAGATLSDSVLAPYHFRESRQ